MGCKYSNFILIRKILFTLNPSKPHFCQWVAEWSHIPPQNRHTCGQHSITSACPPQNRCTCGQHSQGKQSRIASHYSTACVKCNPLSINPLRKLRAPQWRHAVYISHYESMHYISHFNNNQLRIQAHFLYASNRPHVEPQNKSRPEGRPKLLYFSIPLGIRMRRLDESWNPM